MTTINLITTINTSKEIAFDISRDVDVHQKSASPTKERAIAGITSGLISFIKNI